MKRAAILMLIIALMVINCNDSLSQALVVSEYYNATNDPSREWVELVVIEDNLNARGYVLRDNSGSTPPPNNWRGGIVFKDIRYWQNLRAGTIIVINLRGSTIVDSTRDDGYIELAAENDYFFDKVCYYCPQGWSTNALNIAENSDLVQILDSSGNHIHCLGHMPNVGGNFNDYTFWRISANGRMSNGTSVSVVPGEIAEHYSVGFDDQNLWTSISNSYITKGLPNQANSRANRNYKYWSRLRAPVWNNPRMLKTVCNRYNASIEWNHCEDPNRSDGLTGYLVLRVKSSEKALAKAPINGIIYSPGEQLGRATVVALTSGNSYIDPIEIPCGESYTYKVYAYRFNGDYLSQDGDSLNSRGRTYNPICAVADVEKIELKDISIYIQNGSNIICEGDTVVLKYEPMSERVKELVWYRNDVMVNSTNDTLITNQDGKYRLRLIAENDCEMFTNEIEIIIQSRPNAFIFASDSLVTNDTIIYLCPEETLNLRASGGIELQWYKDEQEISGMNYPDYIVNEAGGYYALINHSSKCNKRTSTVQVKHKIIEISTNKNFLSFNLPFTQSFEEQVLICTNNNDNTVRVLLSEILMPPGYRIVSPSVEYYDLLPGLELEIIIRFTPHKYGYSNGIMKIKGECGIEKEIELRGFQGHSHLLSDESTYKFDKHIFCDVEPKELSVLLSNPGDKNISIINYNMLAPFSISDVQLPLIISPLGSEELVFRFLQNIPGEYKAKCVFEYIIDYDADSIFTLEIELSGEVISPSLVVELTNDKLIVPDCSDNAESDILLINDGQIAISINKQPSDQRILFNNLPLNIAPGDSAYLAIKFTPGSTYLEGSPVDFIIEAEPCNIAKQVQISAEIYQLEFSIDDEMINYGDVVICHTNEVFPRQTTLRVNGKSLVESKIEAIDIFPSSDETVETDLIVGQVLGNRTQLILNVNPKAPGFYTGKLVLKLSPCNEEIELNYSINATEQIVYCPNDFIDLGICYIGQTISDTLFICNDGLTDVRIDKISGISPPFYYDETKFPLIVGSKERFPVLIDFNPQSDNIFSSECTFNSVLPCENSYRFKLRGESTVQDMSGEAFAIIPRVSAIIGEDLLLPVRIVAIPPLDFKSSNIAAIEIRLKYNRRVFHIDRILPGSVFLLQNAFITAVENAAGDLTIMMDQIDPLGVSDGEFFIISGKVLLGDALMTDVILDTVIFHSDGEITVETRDGRIDIVGDCLPSERLVNVGGKIDLFNVGNNPADYYMEIGFSIVSDELTILTLFDDTGLKVRDIISSELSPGSYKITIPTSNLSQGTYILRLQNGFLIKSLKVGIIR